MGEKNMLIIASGCFVVGAVWLVVIIFPAGWSYKWGGAIEFEVGLRQGMFVEGGLPAVGHAVTSLFHRTETMKLMEKLDGKMSIRTARYFACGIDAGKQYCNCLNALLWASYWTLLMSFGAAVALFGAGILTFQYFMRYPTEAGRLKAQYALFAAAGAGTAGLFVYFAVVFKINYWSRPDWLSLPFNLHLGVTALVATISNALSIALCAFLKNAPPDSKEIKQGWEVVYGLEGAKAQGAKGVEKGMKAALHAYGKGVGQPDAVYSNPACQQQFPSQHHAPMHNPMYGQKGWGKLQ